MTDTLTPTREQLEELRSGYVRIVERRERPFKEFELRDVPNGTGGTDLLFRGYACVTGAEYDMEDMYGPWTEQVCQGAFAKTLAEDPDVAFLINHGGMTLARTKPGTLALVEDGVGLLSEARLDPTTPQVIALRSAILRGDIDEMSFAFWVTRQEWNGDYTYRWIREVDLNHGDVSAVNFGANGATGGTISIRAKRKDAQPQDALTMERWLSGIDTLREAGSFDLEQLNQKIAGLSAPTGDPDEQSTDDPAELAAVGARMRAELASVR